MSAPDAPRCHYEVHDGEGPYLLLVHGLLSSRAQWAPNLSALKRVARPVVVELLGHGRSPAPDEMSRYLPDAYVAEFEAVRRALGAERWLVCGQSLGAALTLRYALRHPERVIAQVFTNSNSALATDDWSRQVLPAMLALATRLSAVGREALDDLPIHPSRARRLPSLDKQALVADCALHDLAGVGLTAVHTVVPSSVRGEIESNRVPSLLVYGVRETRFDASVRFAIDRMPELEVARLEGGHAVNLEVREGFEAAVVRFFGRF